MCGRFAAKSRTQAISPVLRARRFRGDVRGLAAIEFALIVSFLGIAILNVSDIAVYLYDEMQVQNATQMGARAAFVTCDLTHLPATTACAGLNSAVTTAVHSTSLGSSVSLNGAAPTEGYYCVNSSGALVFVSAVSSKPANCASVGVATGTPGDYVEVQTTYTFSPIFAGASIGSLLPTSITATSWVRLG